MKLLDSKHVKISVNKLNKKDAILSTLGWIIIGLIAWWGFK